MYNTNGSILAATGVSAGLGGIFFGGLGLVVLGLAVFAGLKIAQTIIAKRRS